MKERIQRLINRYPSLLIGLVAALLFLPGLGNVHLFDWDEINFAEAAREMLVTGDWLQVQINYQPFFQKPPLFLWLQALAMAVFGVGEYAARLPNALCGILTLVLLFRLGRRLHNVRIAWLWVAAYAGSVLPFLYFKSGIIDPWFNLFIFLGLYYFILFYWKKEDKQGTVILTRRPVWYLFWAGLFIGLGILTKGPVAYLLAVLTMGVYWVYQRFRFYVSIPQFLLFTFFASLVTLAWFSLDLLQNGGQFIWEFVVYQWRLFSTPDAGHRGFPGYHVVVLLIGCFPASLFAIRRLFKRPEDVQESDQSRDFQRWMKYLFWVVLILFTIVQSKIVHYSSLAYFPLTYLAARAMDDYWTKGVKVPRWLIGALAGIGGLYALATAALPWLGRNIDLLRPLFAKDPFAQGNLEAEVVWTGWEALPGLWLALLLVFVIRYLRRRHFSWAYRFLAIGMAIFISLVLLFDIRRIEGYSQRAAIEFFASLQGEEAYIVTRGYKSYAHLFYPRTLPLDNPQRFDQQWLFYGAIDRPLYVATKVHKVHELADVPDLQELYRKNGFVFFQRLPVGKE